MAHTYMIVNILAVTSSTWHMHLVTTWGGVTVKLLSFLLSNFPDVHYCSSWAHRIHVWWENWKCWKSITKLVWVGPHRMMKVEILRANIFQLACFQATFTTFPCVLPCMSLWSLTFLIDFMLCVPENPVQESKGQQLQTKRFPVYLGKS